MPCSCDVNGVIAGAQPAAPFLLYVQVMNQLERLRYFAACDPPQPLGESFGDHVYDEDETAADLDYEDDEPEDGVQEGRPFGCLGSTSFPSPIAPWQP